MAFDEFFPLRFGETVTLSDRSEGHAWSQLGVATLAEVVASYCSGPVAGSPAVTRNSFGGGIAWYAGTALSPEALEGC